MITDTVSWPEITWTVIAFAGGIVNVWALYSALGDLFYLESRDQNGIRRLVAIGNVREESIRVLIQLIFVIIGIAVMMIPAHTSDNQPSPGTYVAMVGFIVVGALLVILAVLARRDRHRVIYMLRNRRIEAEAEADRRAL